MVDEPDDVCKSRTVFCKILARESGLEAVRSASQTRRRNKVINRGPASQRVGHDLPDQRPQDQGKGVTYAALTCK